MQSANSALGTEFTLAFPRKRSATSTLFLFACLLLAVCGPAAAAPPAKLVVSAPGAAPVNPAKVAIAATLKTPRGAKIKRARFYVNGKLVTTDKRTPFAIKKGVRFDARKLPARKPFVTILVSYEQTLRSGKIAKKSLKKRVRLSFKSGDVGAKGEPPLPPWTGYRLVLNEDFGGDSLNTSVWNDQRLDSIDEEDLETPAMSRPFNFAEGAAYNPDNVTVGDGALKLNVSDDQAPDPSAGDLTRSTGMVNSNKKFSFKYGYVETRAWVPECGGCWPSFWMMPATDDNWPPEIDIFEFFQFSIYSRTYPHTVFHWAPDGTEGDNQFFEHYNTDDAPVPSPKPQEYGVTHPAGEGGNFLNSWHTYGLLWTHDYVEVYIDGKLGTRVNGASKLPQEPMYLIYMMAICRIDGNQCEADTGTPPAGSAMKIDYLRVYSNNT